MAYNIRFLIFPPDSLREGVVSKKDNSISGPVGRRPGARNLVAPSAAIAGARPREGEYMKAANIFTVGVEGLRPIPGVLHFSVCAYVSPSIPSLGGDPDMGEGERAGRSPDLVNRE